MLNAKPSRAAAMAVTVLAAGACARDPMAVPDAALAQPDSAALPPDLAAPDLTLTLRDLSPVLPDLARDLAIPADLTTEPDLLTPPHHLCARRFGDLHEQTVGGLALDAAGNVILTGAFAGSIDFGKGALVAPLGMVARQVTDGFMAKFDPDCNVLWSRQGTDIWGKPAVDGQGSIFVAGASLGRYDAAGRELWRKKWAPAFSIGVAVDIGGNVAIAGYAQGVVDLGGGPLPAKGGQDAFVAKFDRDGKHLFSLRFGDRAAGFGAVAFDAQGNLFVAGTFTGTIDFGGGPLTSGAGSALPVVKLDATGKHLFSRSFAPLAAGDVNAIAVAVDGAGDVTVGGRIDGDYDLGNGVLRNAGGGDAFLVKLDGRTGVSAWSKRFGDAAAQGVRQIGIDRAGRSYVTGWLFGTADFGGGPLTSAGLADVFLARFDAQGRHLGSARYGNAAYQEPYGLATTPDGVVWLAGAFLGEIDFGPGPLRNPDPEADDVFLVDF